jgi:DnaK suppressor protein
MNKRDLKKFEKKLLQERERLLHNIKGIEESSRTESAQERGDDFSSYAESGTDNFSLETALNIAGGEYERLQEIDDALQRIKDGVYGVCEGSGKPIPKKRLEVFPAARYCVEYKEQLEKENVMRNY